MNRLKFLEELNRLLSDLPQATREDIVYDYEEHFRNGLEEGKPEEEIALALGDPSAIARQYRANFAVEQAETKTTTANVFRAVFATVSLGFFNLVFVVGPFIGLLGILLGLFVAAGGITAAGISAFLGTVFAPILPFTFSAADVSGAGRIVVLFASIGFAAFGLLFLIGDYYLARWFYRLTIRYLRFNLNIISK
jgi:uncharacterized membrane protein